MNHPRRFSFSISWSLSLKALILLVPLIGVAGLLNHHFLFTPSVSYRYHPGKTARGISPTQPATVVRTASANLRWKLTTDSLPFQVTVPRAIKDLQVRGKLQTGTQPVVWLKAEGAQDADLYALISSTFFNGLTWTKVTDGTMTLWMRDKREISETVTEGVGKAKKEVQQTWTKNVVQYPSIASFVAHPPDLGMVASLGIDRLMLANLNQVEMPAGGVTLPQIFRGSHQFYIYAQGGQDLRLSFDKVDRNRKKDSDNLIVRVASSANLALRHPSWLETVKVKDDGHTGSNGPQGAAQAVNLTLPQAPAGAYMVDIQTSEDVLITNLSSSSPMLSFTGQVFLAEGPAYGQASFRPLTLLTNGKSLTISPAHEQGKQELTIAGKKYSLKGVNADVTASGLRGITSLVVSQPDVKIISDGLITISPARIFPSAGSHPIDLLQPINLEDVDYIYAAYRVPATKQILFDETYAWDDLALQGNRLQFSLEMPGLVANGRTLALRELQATLIRGSFPWDRVLEKLTGKK